MLIYTNGSWVPEEEAVIPFNDHGFLYGDSLFETIRIDHGRPFRLEKHLDRLQHGLETIALEAGELMTDIPEVLREFIRRNTLQQALIRIMITRGASTARPWNIRAKPALYLSARPLSPLPEWPAKVVFLEEADYPILRFHPAIKSGNYLGNMLAKRDAMQAGAFEPVFVNRDGYITECAIRNIFFIKDHVLLTPAESLGVLPGVIRDTVMEAAELRGLTVREGLILKRELPDMDEAFICSTGIGVLPVTWEGFHSEYHDSLLLKHDLEELFETGVLHVS
jgi:branched-chain amino acid aminotransferase